MKFLQIHEEFLKYSFCKLDDLINNMMLMLHIECEATMLSL